MSKIAQFSRLHGSILSMSAVPGNDGGSDAVLKWLFYARKDTLWSGARTTASAAVSS